MPDIAQICTSLVLILIYLSACLGIYTRLRSSKFTIPESIALAVPSTQAVFSTIFQARFLLSSALFGSACTLLFLVWIAYTIRSKTSQIQKDFKGILGMIKAYRWVFIPLCLVTSYTFLQALLLPITNIDALTYHLPRVWLFIQNDTLFLDYYTRHHEVVFPVGVDILFYPFLSLHTTAGIGIFSLTSYISIGAATYAVTRSFGSAKAAALTTLICLSLTELVLQSASVKNDIIMANVAVVTLMLALRFNKETSYLSLLLFCILCAYGISTKTTYIAFLPGILLLSILKLQLWRADTIKRLYQGFKKYNRVSYASIIPLLILSQSWLFIWNIHHYNSWTGPEALTHRNQQHDGLKGSAANVLRYGIQSIQIGALTNNYLAPKLGIRKPTDSINEIYFEHIEPTIHNLGATREPFEVTWRTHEDFSWFGPFGCFMLFFSIPYTLLRNPRFAISLIPAYAYFAILCIHLSWMPWNGRFMTTFFITLTPALGYFLHSFKAKYLYATICTTAAIFLLVIKLTDYHRPILPTESMTAEDSKLSITSVLKESLKKNRNAWLGAIHYSAAGPGNPPELLRSIPLNAEVAFIGHGNIGHFNFFIARPDIRWIPLDGHRTTGLIAKNKAFDLFFKSNLQHCVIVGEFPDFISERYALHCADGYGHLITKSPKGTPHIVDSPN